MKVRSKIAFALLALAATVGVQAQQKLKIGVAAIMSGDMAPYGLKFNNGVKVAVDQINSKGGITVAGKQYIIDAQFCDTKAKSEDAVSCGRRLSSKDGVPVIIMATSIETYPILGFNQEKAAPFVVITSTASGKLNTLNNKLVGRYWFDISSFMPGFAQRLAYAYNKQLGKLPSIAILEGRDEFAASWVEYFTKSWQAAGGNISRTVKWDHGTTDFYQQISTVLRSNPDVIASTGVCSDNGPIIKQSRELGFKGTFLIDQNCNPTELEKFVDSKSFENSIFIGNSWDLDSDAVTQFKADYERLHNDLPTAISADGYGQLWWAVSSISDAGSIDDPYKIREAMAKTLSQPWNLLKISDLQANGNTTALVFPRLFKNKNEIINFIDSK